MTLIATLLNKMKFLRNLNQQSLKHLQIVPMKKMHLWKMFRIMQCFFR